MISRECALDIPKKELVDMYKDATHDKMGFLLFDLDASPDSKYRKNLDEYYEV
jgi:hypothetical protein